MGCVSSKQPELVTPDFHHSGEFRDNVGSDSGVSSGGNGGFVFELKKKSRSRNRNRNRRSESGLSGSELSESRRTSSNGGGGGESLSFSLGNLYKYVEGEQVGAGWPGWLSSVAGEAIHGWVPRCADSFEKLEKIGQGTYSSVFRARDVDTGRIVALKKVQFNSFETESVRFMAREILILRRLDHPNIIKLEGIVTSTSSSSIYLVFEYMEHDISGLLSSPDVHFSEAQVKCYMKQLLSGLEHCHSRGVMHRDIKGANLLVNNEGIVKVGDFGLANFCNAGNRHPLTSRVVTLWYRPPELLLGSTDYGAYVDLWSVGCVFAELLLGNPVLQGRTEVEQLHKIFKLCGSPPDNYWKTTKLPHATLFKPQHPYESCLWETFKELPNAAVNLLEALLSVEPCKRGTASSALSSEYFTTKPWASDPSSLPKYPPSKEIDAKHREEVKRKIPGGRKRGPESTRKLTRKPINISKLAPEENLPVKTQKADKINGSGVDNQKEDIILALELLKPSISVKEDVSHIKHASHGDIPYSGQIVSGSSGFAWAKGRIDYSSILTRSRSTSRSLKIEPYGASHLHIKVEAKRREYGEVLNENLVNCTGSYELAKHGMLGKRCQFDRPDSFDSSDGYHSYELPLAHHQKEEMAAKRFNSAYQDHGDKVEFSGPLLFESHKVDELLERHERQIRQAVQRTWFQLPNR